MQERTGTPARDVQRTVPGSTRGTGRAVAQPAFRPPRPTGGVPGLPAGLPAGFVAALPADLTARLSGIPAPRSGGSAPRSSRPRAGETPRAKGADRPRTRSRAEARPAPQRSEDHAHLSLAALRAYRQTLLEEETRVSYWRRVLQARLDVLAAGLGDGEVANLRPVLTEQRLSRGRRLLESAVPSDGMPPLPDLEGLWESEADPEDEAGTRVLVERLTGAESDLSAYRSALHARLDAATDELIARYREDPRLCLSVLPLPPGETAAAV